MSLELEDLPAIEARWTDAAARDAFVLKGGFAVADAARTIRALVALARRKAQSAIDLVAKLAEVADERDDLSLAVLNLTKGVAQVADERDRLKLALSEIAATECADYCNVTLPCPRCLASRALEGRPRELGEAGA